MDLAILRKFLLEPANSVKREGLRFRASLIYIFLPSTVSSNRPPSIKTGLTKAMKMEIDLHGYRPSEIVWTNILTKIVQQTWEKGDSYLTLIHGHGRNRGISPGFVNTNTGYFGLEIRRALRHDTQLRQWIKYTTLDCSNMGVTGIKLKPNPAPTRTELDPALLPHLRARTHRRAHDPIGPDQ